MFVEQTAFFQLQPGLSAFTALQKHGTDFFYRAVAHKAKPFGFQTVFDGFGAKLCQRVRFVDQEKVTAVFENMGSSGEKVGGFAGFRMSGQRNAAA